MIEEEIFDFQVEGQGEPMSKILKSNPFTATMLNSIKKMCYSINSMQDMADKMETVLDKQISYLNRMEEQEKLLISLVAKDDTEIENREAHNREIDAVFGRIDSDFGRINRNHEMYVISAYRKSDSLENVMDKQIDAFCYGMTGNKETGTEELTTFVQNNPLVKANAEILEEDDVAEKLRELMFDTWECKYQATPIYLGSKKIYERHMQKVNQIEFEKHLSTCKEKAKECRKYSEEYETFMEDCLVAYAYDADLKKYTTALTSYAITYKTTFAELQASISDAREKGEELKDYYKKNDVNMIAFNPDSKKKPVLSKETKSKISAIDRDIKEVDTLGIRAKSKCRDCQSKVSEKILFMTQNLEN